MGYVEFVQLNSGTGGGGSSGAGLAGASFPVIFDPITNFVGMPQATGLTSGFLSFTDFNIFSSKFSLPGFTQGIIPFMGATTLEQDPPNLYWDNIGKILNTSQIVVMKTATDFGFASGQFNANTNTTVDGSNTTTGIIANANALVQVGATNDKSLNAINGVVQRGDSTDDGDLSAMTGSVQLMFHNSGSSGTTDQVYGHAGLLFLQGGFIGTAYDFFAQTIPAGSGTVGTHYGVYIGPNPFIEKLNWLAGKTQMGGNNFSPGALADATLNTKKFLTDPPSSSNANHLAEASIHITADTTTTLYNEFGNIDVVIDDTFTMGGGVVGYQSQINRNDSSDLGTLGFAAGNYNTFAQSNGNKNTFAYAGYLTGTHSVASGQMTILADFAAFASSIGASIVTTRYGVYIEPDANYSKIHWLCDLVQIGGTALIPPIDSAHIVGSARILDGHLKTNQTITPGFTIGAGLGTGATGSLTNATDVAGFISLTTGALTIAAGIEASVIFTQSYTLAPVVLLTPTNASAAIFTGGAFIGSSTTGFNLNFAIAGAALTTYNWNYLVIETQ